MSDDDPDALQEPDAACMVEPGPACMVEAEALAPELPRPGLWGAIGCCLLILGAQTGISLVVVIVWAMFTMVRGGAPSDPEALQAAMPMTLLIGAATAGTLFSGLLLAAVAYGRQAIRRLALRNASPIQWMAVALIVLPLSVVASELTNWVARFLPDFSTSDVFVQFAQESLPLALLFGALLPALGEEVWFRGIIGRGLVGRFGTVAGIGLTSLLFGLVHIDPVQASGAMLLGIGIHGIYLATRSLYAAIAVHGLNNALAFTALAMHDSLALPGYIPSDEGGLQSTPWPLLLAAVAAVAGLALVLRDTRTRFVLADGQLWNPGYTTAEQPPPTIAATPQNGRVRITSLLVTALAQAAFLAALFGYVRWTS